MVRIFASRLGRLLLGVWVVMLVTTVSGVNLIPAASHNPGGTTSTTTFGLVVLNSTDGLPHYGQDITFNVSTTATSYPSVSVGCAQNGTQVLYWTAGFFPSYQFSDWLSLTTPSWTSGGANCTATLYYSSGKRKIINLATFNFQVYA